MTDQKAKVNYFLTVMGKLSFTSGMLLCVLFGVALLLIDKNQFSDPASLIKQVRAFSVFASFMIIGIGLIVIGGCDD